MVHLIIAIAFGSLFAILFKLFQRHGIDSLQAIGINYFIAWLLGFIGHAATEAPAPWSPCSATSKDTAREKPTHSSWRKARAATKTQRSQK